MSRKDLDCLKYVSIYGELWTHDGLNYSFNCKKCGKSKDIEGRFNLDRLHALQRSGCIYCGNKSNSSPMPMIIEARRRLKLRR